jgi:hypothetical protein
MRYSPAGKAVTGIHVRIKGPKVNVRIKASNAKGVVKQTLKMKKAGIGLHPDRQQGL